MATSKRLAASAADVAKGMTGSIDPAMHRMMTDLSKFSRDAERAFGSNAANTFAGKVDHVTGSMRRLRTETTAVEHEISRMTKAFDIIKKFGGAALPGIGFATAHVATGAVKQGATIEHREAEMRAAGISEAEIAQARTDAVERQKKFPNVAIADQLEMQKEARSVIQDLHHLPETMETLVAARSRLDKQDPTGALGHQLGMLLKGAEVQGIAADPKRLNAYIDSAVRAMAVMGGTITPEQLYEQEKYSKASGLKLSDRFRFTTGMSLAQEMGGSTAGVALNMLQKELQGGLANQHSAAKAIASIGLIADADLDRTKTGEVKGIKAGRYVSGATQAMTDPDKWVNDFYVPALLAKGFDTAEKQLQFTRQAFPNSNASDLVSKLILQRQTFENHAKLYEGAPGLSAADPYRGDAQSGVKSLTTATNNLLGTLTSPAMKTAGEALDGLTGNISHMVETLSTWQDKNPTSAKAVGVGAMGAGALGGGLGTYALISWLKGLLPGSGGAAVSAEAAATAGTSGFGAAMLSRLGIGSAGLGLTIGAAAIHEITRLAHGPNWTPTGDAGAGIDRQITETQARVDRAYANSKNRDAADIITQADRTELQDLRNRRRALDNGERAGTISDRGWMDYGSAIGNAAHPKITPTQGFLDTISGLGHAIDVISGKHHNDEPAKTVNVQGEAEVTTRMQVDFSGISAFASAIVKEVTAQVSIPLARAGETFRGSNGVKSPSGRAAGPV